MEARQRIKHLRADLAQLFSSVRKWLRATPISITSRDVELNEELVGRYEAPMLSLTIAGGHVAELRPIGLSIVGAKGRVDMVGALDSVSLLSLSPGAAITWTVATADRVLDRAARPLFEGVDKAGWYWIEDVQTGRAREIDESLFLELLARVSDYEVA